MKPYGIQNPPHLRKPALSAQRAQPKKIHDLGSGIHDFQRPRRQKLLLCSIPVGDCHTGKPAGTCAKNIVLLISHHNNLLPVCGKIQPRKRFLYDFCLAGSAPIHLASHNLIKIIPQLKMLQDLQHKMLRLRMPPQGCTPSL